MRNDTTTRFAIGLIVFCLFAGCAVTTADAQQLPNAVNLSASDVNTNARLTLRSSGQDDFDDSPCKRFPAEQVFDSFEKALRTPEKVKCLEPKFEGDDLKMKRLPSGLGTLINLEVFSFACLEQLEELPEEIGNLRRLKELIIDNGNGCSMNVALPRSIGKLENLKVLRLYGALDARDMDQRGRRSKIKSLPDAIGDLRKLEVLDLGRNGLTAVPPQIARLSNLKTLRLEYNDLHQIPAFVGNFQNLKELSLDANQIVNLPASLGKLGGLKVSIGNNSIKLRDRKRLQTRFPKIVFSFENEFDDSTANEETKRRKSE